MTVLESALLASLPGLGHGHSTRHEGAVAPSEVPRADANLRDLVRSVGGDPKRLVRCVQVHGGRVATVREDQIGERLGGTDGLATATTDLPLLVLGADCPLGVVVDAEARALAVFHSGWRGTVERIGARATDAVRTLGGSPTQLAAAVFPGIGPCCYPVGEEVRGRFRAAFGRTADRWFTDDAGALRLDLHAAIRSTLVDAGVREDRIDMLRGCTACDGRLWSHRKSGGRPERHGLVAMLRPA